MFLHDARIPGKLFSMLVGLSLLAPAFSHAQHHGRKRTARNDEDPVEATKVNIRDHLRIFDGETAEARYFISLCGDVPLNRKPMKVAHNQQTGHVFLILQKVYADHPSDTLHRVFGYYPKKGLPVLLFKKIKAVVKDNSNREYDVSISRELSAGQFDTALAAARELAARKYHINKFNCYDYAVTVFNRAVETDTLPLVKVRFPFVFGRGGSPCGLYKELMERQAAGNRLASVRLGAYTAPRSTDFPETDYTASGGHE